MKKTIYNIWFWISIGAMCIGIGCAGCDIWRGKSSGFNVAVDFILIAWTGFCAFVASWCGRHSADECNRPRREWP